MRKYTFEPLDKEFSSRVEIGDILLGRENFGSGSSGEQAPRVLKALGIKQWWQNPLQGYFLETPLIYGFLWWFAKKYMIMWKLGVL
ncbi:MAG: hypothetical protein Q8936_00330 [Bacillota bacterium]|nr:hypothetical protein [Bacillota bacterium]